MLPKRRSLFAVRYGEFNSDADMAFMHAPAVEFSAFILDERETFPRSPPMAIILRADREMSSRRHNICSAGANFCGASKSRPVWIVTHIKRAAWA
jgi:hypothetical protein